MSLVVGVGVPTRDRIFELTAAPAPDTSQLVTSLGSFGGGQVATALVAVARLGHEAHLVAAVGDDEDGRVVVAELRDEGVGMQRVRVSAAGRTANSVVLVAPGGTRTILYDPGREVEPVLGDEEHALVAAADGIMLAGTAPFTRGAASAPRAPGSILLLDLDSFDSDEDEIVAACDVVIASASYAASRSLSHEDAARSLHDRGAATAIVTRGDAGAVGIADGAVHAEPAYPVDAVDTTGAGDVYHGAYLVAALEGRGLEDAMRFAAVAAGLKCRCPGGRTGIPRRDELDSLLR